MTELKNLKELLKDEKSEQDNSKPRIYDYKWLTDTLDSTDILFIEEDDTPLLCGLVINIIKRPKYVKSKVSFSDTGIRIELYELKERNLPMPPPISTDGIPVVISSEDGCVCINFKEADKERFTKIIEEYA